MYSSTSPALVTPPLTSRTVLLVMMQGALPKVMLSRKLPTVAFPPVPEMAANTKAVLVWPAGTV